APADGRVLDLRAARKRRLRLAHDERRARHAFDAAGDQECRLATLDRARANADGVHARSAQAVDRRPGNLLRQAREQQRHARHVAIVLARLVGAAVYDVVDRGPVDSRITLDQCSDRHRGEVIGAYRRQAATVAAERCAHRVANEDFLHVSLPVPGYTATAVGASISITPVRRCNSANESPGTRSRTCSPSGATSSTARSVKMRL